MPSCHLRGLRQEAPKFKVSLSSSARFCLKIKVKGVGDGSGGRVPLGSTPRTAKKKKKTTRHNVTHCYTASSLSKALSIFRFF